MQIEISTRHGGLVPETQAHIHDKAEKLLKYFGRLMAIEVEVEHLKHSWQVEIFVSAEHKHDFIAREERADSRIGDGPVRSQDRTTATPV